MAERRMFAKTIVLSDAFLDLPLSTRCLYFTLGMFGDDEGFINNPKSIMRQCGASEDDLKLLILKKFIIPFESGVIVIKHWKIHNYIQSDRKHDTKYQEELSMLSLNENGSYSLKDDMYPKCIQDVSKMDTEVRLGKDRLGKDSSRFTPPTVEEIQAYCDERNNGVDAQRFFDFYSSKGWMIGKNKMKDFKAAVRNWERREPKKDTLPKYEMDIWK